MRMPNVFTAEAIKNWDTDVSIEGYGWVLARPESAYSWKMRFKIAWKVFIGEFDAIWWIGQKK